MRGLSFWHHFIVKYAFPHKFCYFEWYCSDLQFFFFQGNRDQCPLMAQGATWNIEYFLLFCIFPVNSSSCIIILPVICVVPLPNLVSSEKSSLSQTRIVGVLEINPEGIAESLDICIQLSKCCFMVQHKRMRHAVPQAIQQVYY